MKFINNLNEKKQQVIENTDEVEKNI